MTSSIAIDFTTLNPETRAGDPASCDPADGTGIGVDALGNPDLVLAIANSGGDIIAWYPEGFGSVPGGTVYSSECITSHTASTPTSTSTIRVSGPAAGSYSVFAIANVSGLPAAAQSALAAATTASVLDAIILSAAAEPTFSGSLPLTDKKTLVVNASGAGQLNMDLVRVVSRITLSFKNQTTDPLTLHNCSVTIYNINPSRGYLFPVNPDKVSGYDRDLVMTESLLQIPAIDPEDISSTNIVSLPFKNVFPSVAPPGLYPRYLCDISFRIAKSGQVYNAGNPSTYDEFSYTDMPIHDSRSEDILYLKRNQHLKIETRISKRTEEHDVSFFFEVAPWVDKPQTVVFH